MTGARKEIREEALNLTLLCHSSGPSPDGMAPTEARIGLVGLPIRRSTHRYNRYCTDVQTKDERHPRSCLVTSTVLEDGT